MDKEMMEIKASLHKVSDQLKEHAEKSKHDVAAHVKMSEQTKEKVDELLIEQGGLKAQLQAAEQMMAKMQQGSGPVTNESIGARVIKSDAIKAFNTGMPYSAGVRVGSVHAAVTSSDASAGPLIQPTRVAGVVGIPQQRLYIRDLLNWGRTNSNSIEYVRESGFTNNAAPVSENPALAKPQSEITFELESAPVATIAHFILASKQVLDDAGQLQSYIDGRLLYGLKLKEEAQLLKGSGVGLNLNGILTQATAYANPGVTIQNETAIDRLRVAMLQVQLAEYDADGIVLNPIDWATIELTKTTLDSYLFASPTGMAVPGLWGRPVVPTVSIDAGDFLVGAFRYGAQGWDREDANIAVSNQDSDNFRKNMVTILCEERVGLTVFRPAAFVTGELPVVS